eukprot:maker-scaffold_7-snap-gene-16.3-mRNA-1 protein AED:0.01 eAED:0.01 QI:169/1/1/1/1/1/3/334/370
MGNTSSLSPSQRRVRDHIRKHKEYRDKLIQLLLLGAGESGKSTVMKQIRLLNGKQFSEKDKLEVKPKILLGLFTNMVALLKAAKVQNVNFSPEIEKTAEACINRYDTMSRPDGMETVKVTDQDAHILLTLFKDENVKAMIEKSHTFQMEDSWPDFMTRLEDYPAWGGENWVPTPQEILLSRVRTTGVVTELYKQKDSNFQVIDVGGQRSERRKWLNVFRDVSGVIFMVSMSAYNQGLFEDPNVNRLKEALDLWEETAAREELQDAALILFFNKFDLFQKKYFYEGIPLEKPRLSCLEPPTKEDEKGDVECPRAKKWFELTFKKNLNRQEEIYHHFITALDADLMKTVIQNTTFFVLERQLKASGLMGAEN